MSIKTLDQTIDEIIEEVSSWHGVTVAKHRYGGTEFRIRGTEIGHIHEHGLLDISFPMRLRDVLIGEDKTSVHHYRPETGWTTFYIDSDFDMEGAIWLLRISYLFNFARRGLPPEILENELENLGDVSQEVRKIMFKSSYPDPEF